MNGPRILIIDDDRSFAEALSIYLHDHGFQVLQAHCGREGLQAIDGQAPALAIVDAHLPDTPGSQLVGELARRCPGLTSIMVSSDDSPDNTRACLQANAYAFLTKPLIPDQLLQTVRRALDMPAATR